MANLPLELWQAIADLLPRSDVAALRLSQAGCSGLSFGPGGRGAACRVCSCLPSGGAADGLTAAGAGHVGCLRALPEHEWCGREYLVAAAHNHAGMLVELRAQGCPWDQDARVSAGVAASMCGSLETLLLLHSWQGWAGGEAVAAAAADRGDVIEFLCARGFVLRGDEMEYAASNGSLSAVRALHRLGQPAGSQALRAAVRSSLPAAVRALRALGAPWPSGVLCSAVTNGTPDVLRALAADPSPPPGEPALFEIAVAAGRDDMLEPLAQMGQPRQGALAFAVRWGTADMVRTMAACGLPWAGNETAAAAERALADPVGLDMLELLAGLGRPWAGTEALLPAARGDIELLLRLHDLGCPPGAATRAAAAGGQRAALRLLRLELGCPWAGGETLAAVRRGHLGALRALRLELGCPWAGGERAAAGDRHMRRLLDALGCP